MTFELKNKVALVTGGAAGIGLNCVFGLLEKEVRGVTIADVNPEAGNKVLKEIEEKFGKNKAIFIQTDVTDREQFEVSFKKTVETFGNIDILINNAGVFDDLNYEKEVAINVIGTINGIYLGLEKYLPKYKSGSEGVILNMASIAGTQPFAGIPVYVGTKFAVHGMTLSWGLPVHYERTKVRVVGLCPGFTRTALPATVKGKGFHPVYEKLLDTVSDNCPFQNPDEMKPGIMQILEKAPSGTMWVMEGGEPPYQYNMPDRNVIPKVYLQ